MWNLNHLFWILIIFVSLFAECSADIVKTLNILKIVGGCMTGAALILTLCCYCIRAQKRQQEKHQKDMIQNPAQPGVANTNQVQPAAYAQQGVAYTKQAQPAAYSQQAQPGVANTKQGQPGVAYTKQAQPAAFAQQAQPGIAYTSASQNVAYTNKETKGPPPKYSELTTSGTTQF